ncbi:MAG: cysteine synthase family protein, partial [Deltaproteobacteria bacterium]|nr:cysteine synthase family protein [Deltaproteobacteria bacterium]
TTKLSWKKMEKNDLLSNIGSTGAVLLNKIINPVISGSKLYAKLEGLNPGGSVKDRPALYMLKNAVEKGLIKDGAAIIDSSSGNTGISYAMIGAFLGIKVKIYAPSNMSEERKKIMRLYGAELILTPAEESHDGAIKRAMEEYERGGKNMYYMPDQYNNPYNPIAHYETTALELLEQTGGNIDYFATGIGTGGTILGIGKRLKEYNDKIKIIAVVPDNEMHGIEGWKYNYSLNFQGFDADKIIDDFVKVDTEGSYAMLKRLVREEGILCGFSSGANVYGISKLAEKYKGNFATALPDTGSRYLSTRVFAELR